MTNSQGRRARLGTLLAVALGALAILVLPGLASARGGSDDGSESTTTIKSFDQATDTLTLSLPDGQTLAGMVTQRTKIKCEDQRGHRRGHGVRRRETEPGDDRGAHGEEPGDDNGGQGTEPGDDSAGPGPSGHDDNGNGANCSVADLVPGAAVQEVELKFGKDSVKFDEIELAHHSS